MRIVSFRCRAARRRRSTQNAPSTSSLASSVSLHLEGGCTGDRASLVARSLDPEALYLLVHAYIGWKSGEGASLTTCSCDGVVWRSMALASGEGQRRFSKESRHLVRFSVCASEAGGRAFESRPGHHISFAPSLRYAKGVFIVSFALLTPSMERAVEALLVEKLQEFIRSRRRQRPIRSM